ncbi:hypothetical protein C8F01DRAFT_1099943 [Mycena amicta]|nr:hypothetical protein C8F01DRAFT_1099943 [Mycena amicta]
MPVDPLFEALEDADASDPDSERRRAEEHARMNQNRILALQLLLQVEKEFADWKYRNLVEPTRNILRDDFPPSSSEAIEEITILGPRSFPFYERPQCEDVMVVCDFDENGLSIGAPRQTNTYEACSPYRYCAPTSSNYSCRVKENKEAQFMPFPDDTTFPRSEYMSCFGKDSACIWIHRGRDGRLVPQVPNPDDELVIYETIRRLHFDRGFSAAEIDYVLRNVEGMGAQSLRTTRNGGFLWEFIQRDIPNVVWADGHETATAPRLPADFGLDPCEPYDIFARLNRNITGFCANLNCIMHSCGVHISYEWDDAGFGGPILEQQAKLTSLDLFDLKMEEDPEPCHNQCFFWSVDEDEMDEDDDPSDDKRAFLGSLLKLDPDMLPCYLAVIASMDCRKAFRLRRELISDDEVQSNKPKPKRKPKRPKRSKKHPKSITLPEKEPNDYTSHTTPCNHGGQCTKQCPCVKDEVHCERNCLCALDCSQRWKGCNFTCAGRGHCGSRLAKRRDGNRCACREAGRECDPELCTGCDARNVREHYPEEATKVRGRPRRCENMELQRGMCKRIVVDKSEYGFGAFAGEKIREHDIIGEYTGELMFDTEDIDWNQRHIVNIHMGTNYLFGLGKTTVDARTLGNPTRFLNDSKPDKPNCEADVVTVNGQRRILIRALQAIGENQQLTLSYGEEYWAGSSVIQTHTDREKAMSDDEL